MEFRSARSPREMVTMLCLAICALFLSAPMAKAAPTSPRSTVRETIVHDRAGPIAQTAINVINFSECISATRAIHIETPDSPRDMPRQAYEKEFDVEGFHYTFSEYLAEHSARQGIHLGNAIKRGPN